MGFAVIAGLIGLLCLAPGPAAAEPKPEPERPLNVIPWLESGTAAAAAGPAAPSGVVEVAPLAPPLPGAAGLAAPAPDGPLASFWAGTSAPEAARLLARLRGAGAPAQRDLARRIAIVRAPPPAAAAAGEGDAVLRARVSLLARMGDLRAGRDLLAAARSQTAEAAYLAFELALLDADDEAGCAGAMARADLALSAAETLFCAALLGDPEAYPGGAAAGLEAARGADRLVAAALAAFLDGAAGAAAGSDAAAAGARAIGDAERIAAVSPLGVALARRLGTGAPPDAALDFVAAELRRGAGRRARLEAAERLVEDGLLEPSALRRLFLLGRAAESGGVWGRAEAMRIAAAAGDDAARLRAIALGFERGADAGRRIAMARVLAPEIASLARPWPEDMAGDLLAAALLSGVAPDPGALDADKALAAAYRLIEGSAPTAARAAPDVAALVAAPGLRAHLAGAALSALATGGERGGAGSDASGGSGGGGGGGGPADWDVDALAAFGDAPRAVRVLGALAKLDARADISPRAFARALAALAEEGFGDEARLIAAETIALAADR